MGGDDLGSDDEYLAAAVEGDSSGDDEQDVLLEERNTKKRTRSSDGDNDGDKLSPKSNKKKKKKHKKGRDSTKNVDNVHDLSTDLQASFLTKWTYKKFATNHLVNTKTINATASNNMLERITQVISKKKLKKWNTKSPMIVIVCLSARRAVQILKELAPSRLRVAKLFAKHMSIEQQIEMLQSSTFAIAIGTPHRLVTLASGGNADQEGEKDKKKKKEIDDEERVTSAPAALSFQRTQLVVLDAHLNQKNFSVCTLPDTAPYTERLLADFVHSEVQRRKDIRLAFL